MIKICLVLVLVVAVSREYCNVLRAESASGQIEKMKYLGIGE